MEVFASNPISKIKILPVVQTNMQFFFKVKRQEGSFDQPFPFLIHKSFQASVGDPKTIKKKLWFGELLIDVSNDKQAVNLKYDFILEASLSL